MKSPGTPQSRRAFVGRLAAGALAAGATPHLISGSERRERHVMAARRYRSANDQIQLAVIGAGGMGMADVNTALQVPGVKLVAAADVYEGRLTAAREIHGSDVFTTRDYREVLARDDIDAVIVGTPDHWHMRISVDALRAGKGIAFFWPGRKTRSTLVVSPARLRSFARPTTARPSTPKSFMAARATLS